MPSTKSVTFTFLINKGFITMFGQVVTKVVTNITPNTRHLWTDLSPPYRGEDVQMMCFT